MKRLKRGYSRIDFIIGCCLILVIVVSQYPQVVPFFLGVLFMVGLYKYFAAFKKSHLNLRKLDDHIFVLLTVFYWKTKTKLFAGVILLIMLAALIMSVRNPIIWGIVSFLFTLVFFSFIGYGLVWVCRFFKVMMMNVFQINSIQPIEAVDQMNGEQFQHYLIPLFRHQGYQVLTARGSGDFGANLILRRKKVKVVVQVKCYEDDQNVGVDAINEVIGATGYYNATSQMVVTNRDYTEAAKDTARRNGVTLYNREDLIHMISEYTHRQVKVTRPKPPIEM